MAAGLEGRSANAARCKVRNDIRAAQTTYRHKRREYGRLLFRVAYRMEELGLRLEELGPADLAAELSPADHPRIHAAYCRAEAGAGASPRADAEPDRPASPPAWAPDHDDRCAPAWAPIAGPGPAEQGCDEAAYRLMFLMGHWGAASD